MRPEAGNVFNFNRYAYARNNPTFYSDPNGRDPWPSFFASMLSSIHQMLNNDAQQHYVQPALLAYHSIDNNVAITQSGQITGGVGGQLTSDVLHPEKTTGSIVTGFGAQYAIDVAPKNPWVFHLGPNPEPSALDYALDVSAGAGVHGGASMSLDTNWNLSIKPKAGIGIGEVVNLKIPHLHADVQPSMEIDPNEDQGTERLHLPPPPSGQDTNG